MHVPFGSGLQWQPLGRGEPWGAHLVAADIQLHVTVAPWLASLRDGEGVFLRATNYNKSFLSWEEGATNLRGLSESLRLDGGQKIGSFGALRTQRQAATLEPVTAEHRVLLPNGPHLLLQGCSLTTVAAIFLAFLKNGTWASHPQKRTRKVQRVPGTFHFSPSCTATGESQPRFYAGPAPGLYGSAGWMKPTVLWRGTQIPSSWYRVRGCGLVPAQTAQSSLRIPDQSEQQLKASPPPAARCWPAPEDETTVPWSPHTAGASATSSSCCRRADDRKSHGANVSSCSWNIRSIIYTEVDWLEAQRAHWRQLLAHNPWLFRDSIYFRLHWWV